MGDSSSKEGNQNQNKDENKNQNMEITLPENPLDKITAEQYDKELYDYLEQNPDLFNEIKEIIREEHSLDNIQQNTTEVPIEYFTYIYIYLTY